MNYYDKRLEAQFPYDRQEALRVCHLYYRNRGYSEEHCHDYLDHEDDFTLKNAYYIILQEQEDAKSKGFSVL